MPDGGPQNNLAQLNQAEQDARADWRATQAGGDQAAIAAAHQRHSEAVQALQQAEHAARSPEEKQRAEQLRRAQASAFHDKMNAPLPTVPSDTGGTARPEAEGADDDDEGLDPVERLAQGRAAAGLAQSVSASGNAGDMDPREKLQGQIDRANHYMLVEILPQVIAFDASCFLLTTCITLPLVYWPIAAIWGLEVYNDYTGNSTPFTPRLTWKSFAPPGTEIDMPLPTVPLWIGWLAYVFLLVFFTALWMLIIAVFATQLSAPIAGFMSGFNVLFPFLPSVGGI